MNKGFRGMKWFALLLGSVIALNVYGDTIYCEGNKKMMCLGFGEKVVKSNALCFDPMSCSQEGFVCKSELTGLADEHEALLGKHNELVDIHNELITTHENTLSDYQELQRCVGAASTLDEARDCL